MYVQVKSSNGITLIPEDTRLLADRRILIDGEINSELACGFMKRIILLSKENEQAISVIVNSPGGEVNSGLMIYDIIQSSHVPIKMYCAGRAYSMAALLFASGKHGRYMLPHAELMLHEPILGNHVTGNASSIRSISDSLIDTRRKLNFILAKHTGRSENEIEKATAFDHYFSPEESVEFGLADAVVGFDTLTEG